MKKQLSRKMLNQILEAQKIEQISFEQLEQSVLNDEAIAKFSPDGVCQMDPRTGDRIIYNSKRASRPHDNRPAETNTLLSEIEKECVICQGKTTNVLDIADLSEGFTFINKNLFPVFYPFKKVETIVPALDSLKKDVQVSGFHLLQWTSSLHAKDWQNMQLIDRIIVMQRLAAIEKKLMDGGIKYVSIIKNYGHLVGGSLVHGHQQIGASNIKPNRVCQNQAFEEKFGKLFSAYMLLETPNQLTIKDYGFAVLIVPYFMKRPYDMILLLKDSTKAFIHELNSDEIAAVAEGWHDAIRIMLSIMPKIGREPAYNITTHNGFGAGLYFEFLPYTQEMGGFEQLGLFSCQGNPYVIATNARDILSTDY